MVLQHPDVVREMEAAYDAWWDSVQPYLVNENAVAPLVNPFKDRFGKQFGAGSASKPNFVFILADDLGWRDLGCYGSPFYETPHLDRLAARGMRFTQAYAACNVCSPTRASLLTGKYPARLHLTDWLPGRPDRPDQRLLRPTLIQQLPLEEVTVAEALRQGGTGRPSSASGTSEEQASTPRTRVLT